MAYVSYKTSSKNVKLQNKDKSSRFTCHQGNCEQSINNTDFKCNVSRLGCGDNYLGVERDRFVPDCTPAPDFRTCPFAVCTDWADKYCVACERRHKRKSKTKERPRKSSLQKQKDYDALRKLKLVELAILQRKAYCRRRCAKTKTGVQEQVDVCECECEQLGPVEVDLCQTDLTAKLVESKEDQLRKVKVAKTKKNNTTLLPVRKVKNIGIQVGLNPQGNNKTNTLYRAAYALRRNENQTQTQIFNNHNKTSQTKGLTTYGIFNTSSFTQTKRPRLCHKETQTEAAPRRKTVTDNLKSTDKSETKNTPSQPFLSRLFSKDADDKKPIKTIETDRDMYLEWVFNEKEKRSPKATFIDNFKKQAIFKNIPGKKPSHEIPEDTRKAIYFQYETLPLSKRGKMGYDISEELLDSIYLQYISLPRDQRGSVGKDISEDIRKAIELHYKESRGSFRDEIPEDVLNAIYFEYETLSRKQRGGITDAECLALIEKQEKAERGNNDDLRNSGLSLPTLRSSDRLSLEASSRPTLGNTPRPTKGNSLRTILGNSPRPSLGSTPRSTFGNYYHPTREGLPSKALRSFSPDPDEEAKVKDQEQPEKKSYRFLTPVRYRRRPPWSAPASPGNHKNRKFKFNML